MKTWQKILAGLALVLIALAAFISTRSDHFSLSRSTEINAAPEKIYPLLANFHGWQKWSPWDKIDPKMQRTYEGEPATVGHSYAWQGNDDVGSGQMTLLEVQAPSKIHIKLEFIKPFAQTNDTRFSLITNSGKTQVFWTMEGTSKTFPEKFLTLFMDRMVGPDFEQGLAALKQQAEAK